MENMKKTIGKNISILRKSKKLTQGELAQELSYSDKAISKWETGESLPDVETLYGLAQYFGVTMDSLISDDLEENMNAHLIPKENISNKLIIALLSVISVWLIATSVYVYTTTILQLADTWKIFVYAVPTSCVVLFVFNKIWGRRLYGFFIISVFVWSTLLCIFLHFLQYNSWMIFIIGVPMQIAIILWSQLKRHS